MTDQKLKRTFLLYEDTIRAIELLARRTRRSRSAIVDLAIESYCQALTDQSGKVRLYQGDNKFKRDEVKED